MSTQARGEAGGRGPQVEYPMEGVAEGGGGPKAPLGSKIVGYPILAFLLATFGYIGYAVATGTNEPWTEEDFRLPTQDEMDQSIAARKAKLQDALDQAAAKQQEQ